MSCDGSRPNAARLVRLLQIRLRGLGRWPSRKELLRDRSRAIEAAVAEKLARLERTRLARECARLEPSHERALAEEGLVADLREWPEY